LHSIAMTPCLDQTFVFNNTSNILTIAGSPFPVNSHAGYLLRMFKFWRGSSRILIKFISCPLVSARFRITIFPVGSATDDVGALGDVPSWVVTVKGSEEVAFEIPYLQLHQWMKADMNDYDEPIVKIILLDPISQPFDKVVSVAAVVYRSAASDIKFAGLQSCVGSAIFQSVSDSMARADRMASRVTESFAYQGGIDDVYSILGRYSTRGTDPSNHFPFPLKIQNKTHLKKLDNFDYLANIYKFFAGDTHVKILFSQAPANGVVQATIGNTNEVVGGADFKAGNGLIVSHQAIWPVLEMVFPYMCVDEFNSIWEIEPMFSQLVSKEATIAEYLISMTNDFRLFYLMPMPEFEFEEVAAFQSVSRLVGNTSFCGKNTLTVGASSFSVLLLSDPSINGKMVNGEIVMNLMSTGGTGDAFLVSLGSTSLSGIASSSVAGTFCSGVITTNSTGQKLQVENAWAASFSDNLYLNVQVISSVIIATSITFNWVVQIGPFSSLIALTNGTNSLAVGQVEITNTSPLGVHVFDQPIDVNLVSSSITLDVHADNDPLNVHVTNDTLSVDVVQCDTTVDVNVTNDPLVVHVDDSTPVSVEGRVQGVLVPDTPVFTTSYFVVPT